MRVRASIWLTVMGLMAFAVAARGEDPNLSAKRQGAHRSTKPPSLSNLRGAQIKSTGVRVSSIIIVGRDGNEGEVILSDSVQVARDSKPARWNEIKPGDRIIGFGSGPSGVINYLLLRSAESLAVEEAEIREEAEFRRNHLEKHSVFPRAEPAVLVGSVLYAYERGDWRLDLIAKGGMQYELIVPTETRLARNGRVVSWNEIMPGDRIGSVAMTQDDGLVKINFSAGDSGDREAAAKVSWEPKNFFSGEPAVKKDGIITTIVEVREIPKPPKPDYPGQNKILIRDGRVRTVVGGGSGLILTDASGKAYYGELTRNSHLRNDNVEIEWWQIDEGDFVVEAIIDQKMERFVLVRIKKSSSVKNH